MFIALLKFKKLYLVRSIIYSYSSSITERSSQQRTSQAKYMRKRKRSVREKERELSPEMVLKIFIKCLPLKGEQVEYVWHPIGSKIYALYYTYMNTIVYYKYKSNQYFNVIMHLKVNEKHDTIQLLRQNDQIKESQAPDP